MSDASESQNEASAALDQRLEQALAGDRNALIDLLESLGPRVRGRIAARIGPHHRSSIDEDDVMQVTYLEAVTRLASFRGGGSSGFLAWLSRLAENNLVDAIRMIEAEKRPNPKKRVRASRVSPETDSMVALIEMVGVTSSAPSEGAAHDEVKRALDAVFARMPPDYAQVIMMYDLQGQPAAAVAAEMGRSEGAIYMLRARAHDRLRDELPSESKFFSVG
ncbi:MAG: sigma-70 family RNA polymerase sigma factor [Planctomycetota bacterium]